MLGQVIITINYSLLTILPALPAPDSSRSLLFIMGRLPMFVPDLVSFSGEPVFVFVRSLFIFVRSLRTFVRSVRTFVRSLRIFSDKIFCGQRAVVVSKIRPDFHHRQRCQVQELQHKMLLMQRLSVQPFLSTIFMLLSMACRGQPRKNPCAPLFLPFVIFMSYLRVCFESIILNEGRKNA